MEEITNTTQQMKGEPGLLMALGLALGGEASIHAQEAQGQREVVSSQALPTEILHNTREDFEALGFVFGEPVPGDPLFTWVTLPDGWTKQGSDHDLWSSVLDTRGLSRVSVFYKAAFYDRRAHMSLSNVGYDVAIDHIYGDQDTFTLPEGLTSAEIESVRLSVLTYLSDAERHPDIFAGRSSRANQVLAALPTSKDRP